MRHSEVSQLLGTMAMFDRRQSTADEDVIAWQQILPENLTLELALAAVRKFYSTPAEAQYDPVLTSRQLIRYAKLVRGDRSVAVRRAAAIEAAETAKQLGARTRAPLQIGGMGIRLKSPDDA